MERIRQLRNEMGLSQAKLAVKADMDPATLNRLEQGKGNPNIRTLERVAEALGVEVADLFPKVPAPSPELPFNNGLEDERRTQDLYAWKSYLARRVQWCEKVLQKRPEDDWNNPFLSLDTAIQWAIYVGIESVQLRNTIQAEVLPYANGDSELVDALRDLLDRFKALEAQTDAEVKTMMEEAGLSEEDQERRLRLIEGAA